MQKNTILPYSARKIKVKQPDPNSVLNPLTSSLSPSEKSYGVRLSSANMTGIQMNKQGKNVAPLRKSGNLMKPLRSKVL
jgi:hypothetical protein